ncbi:Hsp20/alpha crystallin family protein [Lyngbya confervoides]|uniref:Hsp20/alpha crystallin family protein n=1 Tax=Lyngbya confervoides BDU141951 TaxID=1574623 RepID=A0ABD4T1B1_9CYAN|nr:Hsp20/alpha crystallin family protein [Lyngbya confervoides]MCM1982364.1 Hsp20/alpha crystallin family protein [Lyngbya confervoides BDU141951]
MMIRYWNPAQDALSLSRQIDRLFESFPNAQESEALTTWTPAIELKETDDHLLLSVYLPGVEGQDLDIQLTRESILITGQRQRPDLQGSEKLLHSDVRYGQFRRLVQLPVAIQNSQAQASFEQGILVLTLPKVEEAKQKVVKLTLAQNHPEHQAEAPQS